MLVVTYASITAQTTVACAVCLLGAHSNSMAGKTERFAVRLTAEQDALIRRAAEVEGTDLTNFTVTATLAHARNVLADRRLFELDDAAWGGVSGVARPPGVGRASLQALFAYPQRSVFDAEA